MSSPVINLNGMIAVWKRQLGSLLGNPLGYLFIGAFVVASAAILYVPDAFFNRNISDLSPLWDDKTWIGIAWMPVLLAVLLPIIAMGSWASEREQGTEELLLTLPLSIADAVIGKYLAIVSYFTLALVFTLSNVLVLAWLGNPDYGLILANYLGWWLGGVVLASAALLGSVLVPLPSIALVVGLILGVLTLGLASVANWFDPFNRGLVPTGNLVAAIGLTGVFVALSMLVLSSRRWRPATMGQVGSQVISIIFALVIAFHCARTANRHAVDIDASQEGLASISADSRTILDKVQQQVAIDAFISQNLPTDLLVKGKEVEDKLKAVERLGGAKIRLTWHRPKDSIEGAALTRTYGIRPRKLITETVAGRDLEDVFLGAVVTSGASQPVTIEHFDPGLSVEYELIRAVRAVGTSDKRKVIGIAETDLKINGDFDMQSYQQIPAWDIVEEWRKSYDVRPVNMDSDIASDVDVLVVPQPSTLTQPQLERLHDYVWNGRPALLLEDAMPIFQVGRGRQDLLPTMPKKNPQQSQFGGPQEGGPEKGKIAPFMAALGLTYDPRTLVSSDYSPSHQFRKLIPMPLVWTSSDLGCFAAAPVVEGVKSALFPQPSIFRFDPSKPAKLEVKPLIFVAGGKVPWGTSDLESMMNRDFMGRVNIGKAKVVTPGDPANPPFIAAEITGTMASAYAKAPQVTGPATAAAPAGEVKVGQESATPIHVIVIGDTDFTSDELYGIYRNEGGRIDRTEMSFLTNLRNIQFVCNAIDVLLGETGLVSLRARQPQPRPLKRAEDVFIATQKAVSDVVDSAEKAQTATVKAATERLENKVKAIQDNQDLDDIDKIQKAELVRAAEQRAVDRETEAAKLEAQTRINEARAVQQEALRADRFRVRLASMTIPAALLALLALAVFVNRLAAERSHIPTSRKRN
jgi:ABC-2 type transport system permease protein